jgi:GWxTD domain-containing protein
MTLFRYVINIRITLLLFFVCSWIIAQPSNNRDKNPRGNLFEINILPVNDSSDCYLSFSIPYNRLIFVKSGNTFSAGVQLFFDVKLNNRIEQRKSFAKKVLVDSYEESQSKEKLLEGFVNFRLAANEYVVYPSLKIDNTNQVINLDSVVISIPKMIINKIYQPVIVQQLKENCAGKGIARLVNRNGRIPFAPDSFSLLIPILDDTKSEVEVKIEQQNQTIFSRTIPLQSSAQLKITDCDDQLILAEDFQDGKSEYVLVENFNRKLSEGPATLTINYGTSESKFVINIEWIDKPVTLSNMNLAIELLEIIYNRSELLELYKTGNQQKYNALVDFWNRKNPDRDYQFNELMYEFYRRADYAMINFGNLANQIGAKTDRGKIYIQFGQPDEIKRDYSSSNAVIEIWYYNDLQKEFIFTDRTGLGNYILSK